MSKKQVTTGTKAKKTIVNIIIHIFLAILAFIWVLPIFWVILTSFRGEKGSYVTTFFPKTYTLNNYVKLFTDTSILNFPKMFVNTFIIAIFTCIISTIFVLSVSYTMSRMRFKMRKPFMNIAMILGLFPSFMSMIAVYYILKALGLAEGSMIRAYITQNDIKKSFVKVGIGAEKKSRIISDKEKRITAFHEAGHAILFHVLPDVGPVYSVSIIPTGAGAAGYTMPLPEKDEMFNTKGKMLQDITVSLGGRVAEELVFDDITTGASQDIKQATKMAKAMVTRYGMSENVGLICYDNDDDEVFIGRDLAHTRGYGEGVATAIDQEVKRIIDECYAKAKQIITENRSVLDACAELLLEKEKISQKEFEELFEPDHIIL